MSLLEKLYDMTIVRCSDGQFRLWYRGQFAKPTFRSAGPLIRYIRLRRRQLKLSDTDFVIKIKIDELV